MKKLLKVLAVAALTLSGLFVAPKTVDASNVLRVGFFAFDGYHMMDDTGNRSGYGYEFIQYMLRYMDDTAEYVGYEKNWSQMQKMLENGEIDILTSAQKTPEREEKFDFSDPIGTSAAILTVKANNTKYTAGEYSSYNGMRVGVIEGNSRNDQFAQFAQEHNFTYTFVTFDSVEEMKKNLQEENQIDAIVTSNLRSLDNEWILDKFAISSFYAMVKKGNTTLLNKINEGIEQLTSTHVGWQDELFEKYYGGESSSSIALTSAQRNYLTSLREKGESITVLVCPDREPYSYVEDGQPKGIIPEIFEELATRLQLPYIYLPCTTREQYANLVNSRSAAVVIDGLSNQSAAENLGYKLTDSYLDFSYARLEKIEFSGEVKKIAALRQADSFDNGLFRLGKNGEIVYYDTTQQCVQAVLDGKVDATYLYDYAANKIVTEDAEALLQFTNIKDATDSLCIAVRSDMSVLLLQALNKGVTSVSNDVVDEVVRKNTDFSLGSLTVLQILQRNPILVVLITGLIGLIVLLIVYTYLRKKSERNITIKNRDLERFTGYVCKSNTSVIEVNLNTNMEQDYVLENDKVKIIDKPYEFGDKEYLKNHIHPEDLEKLEEVLQTKKLKQMIRLEGEKYIEYRFKENEGYHWYATMIASIPMDEGHPCNFIIFKRDINEVKSSEEEHKRSLKEALNAANQASESKGSFLSNMSHEIRTPLNAIIGYLTIAKEEENNPSKVSHCIDNCEVASKHLLQIINDVLDMSSIESGKMKIAHEEFDLKKEISDITTIFYQNAKAKSIDFETHVDNLTHEWVYGDALRLNQVLFNLLSNAIKFTPENGHVLLKIRQMKEDERRVYVQFTVSDTGIGMSEEYLSRIFSPFEQENASVAKKFGGSGLGLSITHNLVGMMGGNIQVDSVQNQGTTFEVTMYFDKSMKEHEKADVGDYSHVRVLVVDDQKDEGTYVKSMLKRCGVKSDSVTSGQEALKQLKRRMDTEYKYDLCILDWKMPDLDGCELTKEIRRIYGTQLPVIIATAYDVSSFEDEALEAGANKVVSKPLFQSTLFDLLVTTFGKYNPELSGHKPQKKYDFNGMKLLLAEDNPMNMEIAVTMIEKAGIVVDQATNGKEALEKFTNSPENTYALILMDVQMPVMDGYEATRQIRRSTHPEAKSIPIIAMTANAFAEDVTDALTAGMNEHISKPINYDKLYGILGKYTKKK